MFRRSSWLTITVLWAVVGFVGNQSVANDEESAFVNKVMGLSKAIVNQHIDPPTLQQLILAGTKGLYRASDQAVPDSLARDVSGVSPDEMVAFLTKIESRFKQQPDLESVFTQAMLRSVPGYSSLIEAEENRINQQVINNRYVGTGIQLGVHPGDNLAQITKVFYDGPAWKAGIKAQDLILEVDGQSAVKMDLREVVEELRGEAGSDVEVVVKQPDSDERRRITMTRNRVFIPSVEGSRENEDGQWIYTLQHEERIGYLRFRTIGPSTLHELRQIARMARKEKLSGIVIDLRMGGGILHDVVMVADSMIDGGTIGHVRNQAATIKHEAQAGDLFDGLPIVVLVSRRTSAGNVFLTAALQDTGRAIVVGEPNLGQTYVRSIVDVPGRSEQLLLATGVMMRGDGTVLLRSDTPVEPGDPRDRQVQTTGFIRPDHRVVDQRELRRGMLVDDQDPVVRKAIEVIQQSSKEMPTSATTENSGD